MTTLRFSSLGRCMRPMTAWPSALTGQHRDPGDGALWCLVALPEACHGGQLAVGQDAPVPDILSGFPARLDHVRRDQAAGFINERSPGRAPLGSIMNLQNTEAGKLPETTK
jgi:hypothetical protein